MFNWDSMIMWDSGSPDLCFVLSTAQQPPTSIAIPNFQHLSSCRVHLWTQFLKQSMAGSPVPFPLDCYTDCLSATHTDQRCAWVGAQPQIADIQHPADQCLAMLPGLWFWSWKCICVSRGGCKIVLTNPIVHLDLKHNVLYTLGSK